jgi:hypothetical protein
MATATHLELTFNCGHVATIDLSALPAARRWARLDYLRAHGVCGDCLADTRAKRKPLPASSDPS